MRPVGAEMFHTDGRTYMTKRTVSLQNTENASNIGYDDPVTCTRVKMVRSNKKQAIYPVLVVKMGRSDNKRMIWPVLVIKLVAFAKVWKVNASVRPLRRQFGSHGTDFDEIWYLNVIRKSVDTLQVSLKVDKNNGYFTLRPIYTYDNIWLNSLQNKNCFRQKLLRKSKHTFSV
jgi:hypothetical protein